MATPTPAAGTKPAPTSKPPQSQPQNPQTKPTEIFSNQTSQLAANLHPILLSSVLVFSFRSLVRDPVNTLLGLAPTVAIIQLAYCVICLPSTGQPPPPAHKSGPKKRSGRPVQDLGTKAVPAFLSLVLTVFLTTPVLYILAILFGAPLTTHIPHTMLLALHLALLTTPQLFFVHGLDAQLWLQIASVQMPLDEVYGMSLGALVGGWVGAVPIPLDWDREWQRWPVTIVAGCYTGAVIGKLVGGYLVKGRRVKIS